MSHKFRTLAKLQNCRLRSRLLYFFVKNQKKTCYVKQPWFKNLTI